MSTRIRHFKHLEIKNTDTRSACKHNNHFLVDAIIIILYSCNEKKRAEIYSYLLVYVNVVVGFICANWHRYKYSIGIFISLFILHMQHSDSSFTLLRPGLFCLGAYTARIHAE